MQVIKITKEIIDLDIMGITLLSRDEYEKYREKIPPVNGIWWLRSPGYGTQNVMLVHFNGNIFDCGCPADYDYTFIRPALKIRGLVSSNIKVRDKFMAGGYMWTVISEGLAVSDDFIGSHCFRENVDADDANDYEVSDIKEYIENWWAINNS